MRILTEFLLMTPVTPSGGSTGGQGVQPTGEGTTPTGPEGKTPPKGGEGEVPPEAPEGDGGFGNFYEGDTPPAGGENALGMLNEMANAAVRFGQQLTQSLQLTSQHQANNQMTQDGDAHVQAQADLGADNAAKQDAVLRQGSDRVNYQAQWSGESFRSVMTTLGRLLGGGFGAGETSKNKNPSNPLTPGGPQTPGTPSKLTGDKSPKITGQTPGSSQPQQTRTPQQTVTFLRNPPQSWSPEGKSEATRLAGLLQQALESQDKAAVKELMGQVAALESQENEAAKEKEEGARAEGAEAEGDTGLKSDQVVKETHGGGENEGGTGGNSGDGGALANQPTEPNPGIIQVLGAKFTSIFSVGGEDRDFEYAMAAAGLRTMKTGKTQCLLGKSVNPVKAWEERQSGGAVGNPLDGSPIADVPGWEIVDTPGAYGSQKSIRDPDGNIYSLQQAQAAVDIRHGRRDRSEYEGDKKMGKLLTLPTPQLERLASGCMETSPIIVSNQGNQSGSPLSLASFGLGARKNLLPVSPYVLASLPDPKAGPGAYTHGMIC